MGNRVVEVVRGSAVGVMEGERALAREVNRRAVLGIFLRGESTTRVRIAEITGLSRPTVNAIVGDLLAEGLVMESGAVGTAGRTAAVYRLDSSARSVIGIDIGGAKILAAIADIGGSVRVERSLPTEADRPGLVARLVKLCNELLAEAGLKPESLVSLVIGTPGVANPSTGLTRFAANIPELSRIDLRRELQAGLGVPVLIDNDVNMAVTGERWRGLAQGTDNVVFIAAGRGLGMGVICGGSLLRGYTGAAGEIGFLPLVGDPFDGVEREFGPMEERVSAEGVERAYESFREAGDPVCADAPAVFAAAGAGVDSAVRAISSVARWLALIISSVHAVLDPERVILGGGISGHPLVLAHLREHLGRLGRRPPVVDASVLGGRAALYGTLALGLREGRRSIGGEAGSP